MAKALGFFVPDAAVSAPRRSAVPRRCALRQTYGIQCSLTPDQTPAKQPALNQHRHHHHHHHHQHKFDGIIPKVSGSSPATKPNSIVCADCDGNGAIQCTQCEGTGVNAVDHFGEGLKLVSYAGCAEERRRFCAETAMELVSSAVS